MNKIAIIGYGRFGALLCDLLAPKYEIAVVETHTSRRNVVTEKSLRLVELSDLGGYDTIIFAVPISTFEEVVSEASQYISDSQLVMDISSVKVHPANILRKHLPQAKLVATHPMFGPDSASKGLKGLQVAVCPLNVTQHTVDDVVSFWEGIGTDVLITTPESHDKDAILSLAFTHSIAKVISRMNISDVQLTTRSFNDIVEVAKLSANDSDQLFHDMLFYNPYFREMKNDFLASMRTVFNRLDEIEKEQLNSDMFANYDSKVSD